MENEFIKSVLYYFIELKPVIFNYISWQNEGGKMK